jgi:hypothetical protein
MSPPVPAVTHRVRLHFKVLEPPTIRREDMTAYVSAVYAPHGIAVDVAPDVEDLTRFETLKDLDVGDCYLGETTPEQKDLFAHRDGVPPDEICIYLVRSTIDKTAGCASREETTDFPKGRPAAVVTKDATAWTLGHECGHVLGLSHVEPITRVMVSSTAKIKVDPPALDPTEVDKIKQSTFVKAVGGPGNPGPTPGSPPPSPPQDDAADAIPSKGDDGERLVDAIRNDLDHEDGVNYNRLADRFGPSAVEALLKIVCRSRPRIAGAAVDLAGRIEGGLPVVAEGAANEDPVVRVSAAAAVRRLPEDPASRLVERLLEDRDVGVRGHAVRSAVAIGTDRLRERVKVLARDDPSEDLRELSARLLEPPGQSAS